MRLISTLVLMLFAFSASAKETVLGVASDSYDNTTSGLAATTLQGAVDELEATKAEVTSQTSVLLQGQNGIANVSNPNDATASPDVVCGSATAGKCLFFGADGEGWTNISLTEWRPQAPHKVSLIAEPLTSVSQASMNGTNCYRNPRRALNDRTTACDAAGTNNMGDTYFFGNGATVLGKVCMYHLTTSLANPTASGCGTCASDDGGLTCINGDQVNVPPADGESIVGSGSCVTYNAPLTNGYFELYALAGEFSEAGGAGICNSGQNHLMIEAEVYRR